MRCRTLEVRSGTRTGRSRVRAAVPAALAVLAWGLGACGGQEAAVREGGWPEALVRELVDMGRRDQAVRSGMTSSSLQDTVFMGRMMRTDSALSRRLMALVEARGWPEAGAVPDSALKAAFLVVQHSPFDAWQAQMLPLVEKSAEAGALSGQEFALLFDRVRGRMGQPQRYGTQLGLEGDTLVLQPLENPDSVDAWREEVGLPPLDDYLDMVREAYDAPVRR